MSEQKHKKTVEKYSGSLEELVEDIGNLHYESLQDFLLLLSKKLNADAIKDTRAGRTKLALQLADASLEIEAAEKSIAKAWIISKPYMKEQ
jgi:hypothetical protein